MSIRGDGSRRERRGATLVLVAMLIFTLVGIGGIALDLSRAYLFKNELQATVDASAMAGALELLLDNPDDAEAMALAYVPHNQVNKVTADVTAGDVDPGTWNFVTQSFTVEPTGDYAAPSVNAIRVRGRHPTAVTLARVFSDAPVTVANQAVAAVGYVGETTCLRPWGVSYQTLLNELSPPSGPPEGVDYDLTPEDVATLASMSYPDNEITLLQGNQNQVAPGNIQALKVHDDWHGNNSYRAAIQGCTSDPIGPGDWVPADPGAGGGQTAQALYDFCNANGGTSGRNHQNFTCLAHPRVKLVIWDIHNGASGANLQFQVKYVGVFAVVSFQGGGNNRQIAGYFTAMASAGAFTPNPSPLRRVVLVQ